MQHDEIARYYTVDEHMRVPELMLVSSATWEQLSAEDQVTIQRCADAAGLYERELWTARETSAREKCLREGTVEIGLPEREKKRFRDAVSPLYKKYCGDYAELVEKINEIRD
jgi:TRAP-type C4-dicarboxylate transport system substrate-binding protein